MKASILISKPIKEVYTPDGITICQNGGIFIELDHYNMHIVPRYQGQSFADFYKEDGELEEIDVYVIGEFEPIQTYNGTVVGIVDRKDDNKQKLVVCNEKDKYSIEQIVALVEFQERFFDSNIIMKENK